MYRKTSVRPGAFSDEDIEVYKEALRRPGALTSSINYYRANVFRSLLRRGVETPSAADGRIRVPTLFIYGEQDRAVIPSTVRDMGRFVDAPYRELRIPDSGHWVQNEAVEEVNNALLSFLAEAN
jgi:pimeloyl-ACP methyl ester carboxylesterase